MALRDRVFRGGSAWDGGCIRVQRANLLLQRVRLTGCQATRGGGLASMDGAITEIEDSRIDGDTASYAGGGLYALGPLFVGNSEIDHDRLEGPGYIGGGGGGVELQAHAVERHSTRSASSQRQVTK